MADPDGTPRSALELDAALQREPYRFDFFQAVRRIECLHPDTARLGESARPADEPVRLAQEPSLAFAPSTLAGFVPGKDGRAPRLSVYFFGLFGPNGPLPLHLTELARQLLRANKPDPTFARFADVFHHRLLSLFYRVWANAQPTVSFDRPQVDRFASYVASLIGLGMPSLRDRDAISDLFKLSHAGQFACATRHADGLRALVSGFFQMPADVEQFVGEWLALPDTSLCRLGESPDTGTLARSAIAGARVWECQYKFRIVLGPLALDEYVDMLPGSPSLERLVALVRNYAGRELVWELQLVLRREAVPRLSMNGTARLGWTTWLTSREMDHDAGDLRLDPEALFTRRSFARTESQPEVRT